MNPKTGEIIELDGLHDLLIKEKDDLVEIINNEMTKKQSVTRKVSLHDHRSKLGKRLTHIRASRNLQRSQRRG